MQEQHLHINSNNVDLIKQLKLINNDNINRFLDNSRGGDKGGGNKYKKVKKRAKRTELINLIKRETRIN